MKTFKVAWTFGGYTLVHAENEEQARKAFDLLDHVAICTEAIQQEPDLDISSVDLVDVSITGFDFNDLTKNAPL